MKTALFLAPEVAMPQGDTLPGYDAVTRAIHWLTALLVFTNIGLGLYAGSLPTGDDAGVARAALAYSLHKTTGVGILGLTLLRILRALGQPGPGLLHPERRAEALAAITVHWALYGALLVMPVAGWLSHAANTGFAPILWPFGQSLPFVPKSQGLVHAFDAVHRAGAWVLYAALGLHVAGALKHALIDRDATLARMTRGVRVPVPSHRPSSRPVLVAALLWAGVIATGVGFGAREVAPPGSGAAAVTAGSGGNWAVSEGSLTFTVRQLGSPVEGRLSGWGATIRYDEATGTGAVRATIPIAGGADRGPDSGQDPGQDSGPGRGMSLGAVTPQALGPEFFDAANHPEAIFEGIIAPVATASAAASHAITGTLTLRGATVPLTLPFALTVTGDRAEARGAVTLDRRDFGMGPGYPDETSVGFAVSVDVTLVAQRQ